MGIKGLWQALKPYTQDGHLSQFKGQRVAIDMYVWLHQALHQGISIREPALHAFFSSSSSANDLDADEEDDDAVIDALMLEVIDIGDGYLDYIVKKIESLQRFGVIPVCVFDGADMPKKAMTNNERRQRRRGAFRDGLRLLRSVCRASSSGTIPRHSAEYATALECFEKAVDISTELAYTVIQLLREERNIECIVSPYEADAQLAYLCREGYVRAAMSEDSDLIAYYCPCILAKLDCFSGRCVVLQPSQSVPLFYATMAAAGFTKRPRAGTSNSNSSSGNILADAAVISSPPGSPQGGTSSLPESQGSNPASSSTNSSISNRSPSEFTYESFLLGCVMSGCDYVSNLRSIGIKTAFKLVAHSQSLPQLVALLQSHYGFPLDEVQKYRSEVLEAFYCFAHHIVYCPMRKELVNYHPLTNRNGGERLKEELVGALWNAGTAQRVCEACLHDPETLQLYKGTYHGSLQSYLRRTRRGQTSLRSFSSFSSHCSAKIVLRPAAAAESGIKQEHNNNNGGGGVEAAEALFGGPLHRVNAAGGYLPRGAESSSSGAEHRVVVRSRYFLKRSGKLAAVEDWSASDNDNEEEHETCRVGGNGEEDIATPISMTASSMLSDVALSSKDSLTTTDTDVAAASNHTSNHRGDTGVVAAAAAAASCPTTITSRSGGDNKRKGEEDAGGDELSRCYLDDKRKDVIVHSLVSDTESSVTILENSQPHPPAQQQQQKKVSEQSKCLCPFGYWQCNERHTIFLQCFRGKSWVKEEPQPQPQATSLVDHHPVSTTAHHGTSNAVTSDDGAVKRSPYAQPISAAAVGAFRAPRRTTTTTTPTTTGAAALPLPAVVGATGVHRGDREVNDTDVDGDVDAAPTDMTRKKTIGINKMSVFEQLTFSMSKK